MTRHVGCLAPELYWEIAAGCCVGIITCKMRPSCQLAARPVSWGGQAVLRIMGGPMWKEGRAEGSLLGFWEEVGGEE